MFLFFVEFLPILEILVEIDLISSPERSKVFFVHFIDGVVLDREEYKSLWVFSKDGFSLFLCNEGGSHANLN